MNINLQNWNPRNRQPGSTIVGLAFDTNRLDVAKKIAAAIRRNGRPSRM